MTGSRRGKTGAMVECESNALDDNGKVVYDNSDEIIVDGGGGNCDGNVVVDDDDNVVCSDLGSTFDVIVDKGELILLLIFVFMSQPLVSLFVLSELTCGTLCVIY